MSEKWWLNGLDQRILNRLTAVNCIENKKTGKKIKQLQYIDCNDLFILKYLVDFYESGNMITKVINGKEYFWVHYSTVLEDFPILHIKKEALALRFKKYKNLGLIEIPMLQQGWDECQEKGKTKKRWGTYSYFRFTDLFIQCIKPKDTIETNQEKIEEDNKVVKLQSKMN
jgi:hypothetical protein